MGRQQRLRSTRDTYSGHRALVPVGMTALAGPLAPGVQFAAMSTDIVAENSDRTPTPSPSQTSLIPNTTAYSLLHWLAGYRGLESPPLPKVRIYLATVAVIYLPLAIAALLGSRARHRCDGYTIAPAAYKRDCVQQCPVLSAMRIFQSG